jgi:nucleoside-diphosphate-sugar epimerase
MIEMRKDARVCVAGHRGLAGSAIMRRLEEEGSSNVETATREQLDLPDQAAVNYWFRASRPEYMFLVAGTVGGILANSARPEHVNVGTGEDLTIRELAEMVQGVVHPRASLVFDAAKPDGTPKELLDVSRLHALGWRHKIPLREGIESSYRWFLENRDHARGAGKGAAA